MYTTHLVALLFNMIVGADKLKVGISGIGPSILTKAIDSCPGHQVRRLALASFQPEPSRHRGYPGGERNHHPNGKQHLRRALVHSCFFTRWFPKCNSAGTMPDDAISTEVS